MGGLCHFFRDRNTEQGTGLGGYLIISVRAMPRLRYLCFLQVEMSKRLLVPGLELGGKA